MDEDKLNRLPPDVKKQFLKLALKLSEKKTKSKVHDDFLTFVNTYGLNLLKVGTTKKLLQNLMILQMVK